MRYPQILLVLLPAMPMKTGYAQKEAMSRGNLMELSQVLLVAAKTQEPTDSLVAALRNVPPQRIREQLASEEEKKAFWINLYNGFTQILLTQEPKQFEQRNRFFKSKQIIVAGQRLSLDVMEHGILRRSKTKWSLGYIGKLFPQRFERLYRVRQVDNRIHFALNCGARSCPPIGFYRPHVLDAQLTLALRAHLKNELEFSSDSTTVFLPTFMSWFRADFGGKKGMRDLLHDYHIVPPTSSPKIKFKKYNWSLALRQYVSED
jgi:hypothetical protein